MSTGTTKRQPLLKYWTTRYLLTLLIGLLLIGVLTTFWLRRNTAQRHLASLKALAAAAAERVVGPGGGLQIGPSLTGEIERGRRLLGLGAELSLFIVNPENRIVYSTPDRPPLALLERITIPSYVDEGFQLLNLGPQARFHILKQTIKVKEREIGAVYLIYPHRPLNTNPEEVDFLFFMLGSLAVLGWGVIYLLTRHLAKPIQKVAAAARQIVEGDLRPTLDPEVRETELYELIRAFNDMTARLRHLEALRTELLAGVTHELKTPVAAISGLLQAVRDRVVTGPEAREFLALAVEETTRLQRMVEDLLAFNAFAAGELRIEKTLCPLHALVREIAAQWRRGQATGQVNIEVRPLPTATDPAVATDPLRLRQILYNLFNNAQQALAVEGKTEGLIEVTFDETGEEIRINVTDNGPGIPPTEQAFIFERFFRGKAKTGRVRGMGLGLPFSKMIAQALGGDLYLKATSAHGTTFTLVLRKHS
ncbi:MAG: HAMP domain-containing histidine kinase [Firmicutes bacterium]|nr:HAMP domain-containing histidine kinase [Bacillota bacterium]